MKRLYSDFDVSLAIDDLRVILLTGNGIKASNATTTVPVIR
jgi:hypothetical protein